MDRSICSSLNGVGTVINLNRLRDQRFQQKPLLHEESLYVVEDVEMVTALQGKHASLLV